LYEVVQGGRFLTFRQIRKLQGEGWGSVDLPSEAGAPILSQLCDAINFVTRNTGQKFFVDNVNGK
jgi:hypothetical protein